MKIIKIFAAPESKGGGQVVALPCLRRINEAELGADHVRNKNRLRCRVMGFSIDLMSAKSIDQVDGMARQHIAELFNPDTILLLLPPLTRHSTLPALNGIIEYAQNQGRLVYIKDVKSEEVVVSGPAGSAESVAMFTTPLTAVRGNRESFAGIKSGSVVISPLIYEAKRPGPMVNRGVLVLTSLRPNILSDLAGVQPFNAYSGYLATKLNSLLVP